MTTAARHEIATILRFLVVGLFNTAIGYGIILSGLWLGAGDYLANAIGFALGLPLAHALHRRFTFRAATRVRRAEFVQFTLVFALAYGANLAVITAGRQLGYIDNPLVQLLAIGTHASVLYGLNRLVVFREAGKA